jgi:hypothetical protein
MPVDDKAIKAAAIAARRTVVKTRKTQPPSKAIVRGRHARLGLAGSKIARLRGRSLVLSGTVTENRERLRRFPIRVTTPALALAQARERIALAPDCASRRSSLRCSLWTGRPGASLRPALLRSGRARFRASGSSRPVKSVGATSYDPLTGRSVRCSGPFTTTGRGAALPSSLLLADHSGRLALDLRDARNQAKRALRPDGFRHLGRDGDSNVRPRPCVRPATPVRVVCASHSGCSGRSDSWLIGRSKGRKGFP